MGKISIWNFLINEKKFLSFLGTRFFLTLAIQMQSVIAGWEVYNLTHDALSLGLIGLAEAIPAIGLALIAGYFADHYNRKKILISAIFVMILAVFILIYACSKDTIQHLGISGSVILIYIAIFIHGIARGFYSPTAFAFLSQLIDREKIARASTINSAIWQIAAISGPALAGFLFAWIGITVSLIIVLLCMIFALLFLLKVHYTYIPLITSKEPFFNSLKKGLQFVWNKKIILSSLSLDMFSVLFGGAVALLPIFSDEILHVGAEGLGLLRSAPSIGSVITMFWLGTQKPIHKAGVVLPIVVFGFGCSMIAFGLSTWFYSSMLFLFLSGVFDSISVVIRSNIIQLETPEEMKGRVSAVNTIFIGSSNEIGAFESGVAAKLLGTVPSVVFGGCMTLGVVITTVIRSSALRNYTTPNLRK